MRPALAFLGGGILIWIVANGKAGAVWQAMTGAPTAARPPDPSTGTTPPATTPFPPSPFKPPSGGPIVKPWGT